VLVEKKNVFSFFFNMPRFYTLQNLPAGACKYYLLKVIRGAGRKMAQVFTIFFSYKVP